MQFNLRSNAGDNRWGFGVRLRDLAGLPSSALSNTADSIQFTLVREAGVFRFSGSFDQGRGHGTYTFTPDTTFITNMGAAGFRPLATNDIVRLAVIDVTVAHVRGLSQAGYNALSLDDVIRTRIHRVTPEFVRDLGAVGYKGTGAHEDPQGRRPVHPRRARRRPGGADAGRRGRPRHPRPSLAKARLIM